MVNCYKTDYSDIETNFTDHVVIQKGITYTSPSVKSFQAYGKPLVLKKGRWELFMGCQRQEVS